MDIKSQPVENQQKWLRQRGWHPGNTPGTWIDPDTRTSYITSVAVDRALADCRITSDMELKPDAPPRKDDAPFPLPKS
jgi:hypothetical protein